MTRHVVRLDPGTLDALAAGYTVLSRVLLSAPSQEALDRLRDPAMLRDWPMPPTEPTRQGQRALSRSREAGEDAVAVKRDYNRLFVGPERLLAPPYESVHRSRDRLVFEAETFQVRAFYACFGLAAPRRDREPDDHIGLELELLATLCLQALDAMEVSDTERAAVLVSAQQDFLSTHLLAWAPHLMALIIEHADTAFYAGIGALGEGVLSEAARLLPTSTVQA